MALDRGWGSPHNCSRDGAPVHGGVKNHKGAGTVEIRGSVFIVSVDGRIKYAMPASQGISFFRSCHTATPGSGGIPVLGKHKATVRLQTHVICASALGGFGMETERPGRTAVSISEDGNGRKLFARLRREFNFHNRTA